MLLAKTASGAGKINCGVGESVSGKMLYYSNAVLHNTVYHRTYMQTFFEKEEKIRGNGEMKCGW